MMMMQCVCLMIEQTDQTASVAALAPRKRLSRLITAVQTVDVSSPRIILPSFLSLTPSHFSEHVRGVGR